MEANSFVDFDQLLEIDVAHQRPKNGVNTIAEVGWQRKYEL